MQDAAIRITKPPAFNITRGTVALALALSVDLFAALRGNPENS